MLSERTLAGPFRLRGKDVIILFYDFTNDKVMLHVVLGRFSTLEFFELQSEQYLSRNHSFYNQVLSPFQIPVIIKS